MEQLGEKRSEQLREKATPQELKVKDALDRLKFRYWFQRPYICRGEAVRVADFYLTNLHLIIEVDGGYHIGRETQDARRTSQITNGGKSKTRVLRITNREVDSQVDLDKWLLRKIETAKNPSRHM